jgi:hypothetical protein
MAIKKKKKAIRSKLKVRPKIRKVRAKRVVRKKAAPSRDREVKIGFAEKVISQLPTEKMKVEAAKFETGQPQAYYPDTRQRRRDIKLPSGYGDNKIVAMTRDPWWIHTYWEIAPQKEQEIYNRMRSEGAQSDGSILRVYDITGVKDFNGTNANYSFDIRLTGLAQNWYIDVATPNRNWCVDIGLLAKDGRFYTLARSNSVHTPRFGMSEVLDEEWMCAEDDYWKLFGLSGGFGIGKSSMEIKELFQRYFKEWVSSGAVSSFSSFILAQKK